MIPPQELKKLLDDLDRVIDNYKDQMSPDLEKELESIWTRIAHFHRLQSYHTPHTKQLEYHLKSYLDRCHKWARSANRSKRPLRPGDLFIFLNIARAWKVTNCPTGKVYPDRENIWRVVVSARNFLYTMLENWEDKGGDEFYQAGRVAAYSIIGQSYAQLDRFVCELYKEDPANIELVIVAYQNLKGIVETATTINGQEQFCLRLIVDDLSQYIKTMEEENHE